MADFREVAKLDQLAPGQGMTVTVRGVDVALFNVDGSVFAMEDACLHAGVSLGAGELREARSFGVAPTAGATMSRRATRWMSQIAQSRATLCRSLTGQFS